MEIQTYLKIIIRRWWIILLVTLAIGGASIYASRLIPPNYETQTSLRVVTPLGGSLGDVSYQTYYADRLMNTYAQIAASEQIMTEVKAKLGLITLPEISVKTIQNSEIINITVTGSDPTLIAKTANTLAEAIIAKSQVDGGNRETSPQNLDILTGRQVTLQKELDQAKQDREKLIVEYAQTSAQMNVLDRTIQIKEAEYRALQDQYQKAVIDEAVAVYPSIRETFRTTKNILGTKISTLEPELSAMRKEYQELSESSITYSQEAAAAGQTVQNKESAYANLLSQIDSVRIANSKQTKAQDLVIASPAIVPAKPTGPAQILIIGLGILCGLVGGVLLAFLWNTLDTRVVTLEQIRNLTKLPILGGIPNLGQKDRKAPLKSDNINIRTACVTLCTKILLLPQNRPLKTILFTSPNPAEGKSTITMLVAEGLAKANRKVLVVDTDLRKPGDRNLYDNISNKQGLASFLRGEDSLEDVIQVLPNPGIHFLSSGPEAEDPIALLHSPAFTTLLEKTAAYDFVLFDSPALLAVPDAYKLATLVDGIVLIVQRQHTTIENIQTALTQFEDVQSKLLGTIVNRVRQSRISGYYNRKPIHLPNISIRIPGITKPGTM